MNAAGTSLMERLNELPDPRKPSNGTLHDFREILVIAICAMLSDSDSFEDIALWGRLKESWLRRFLVLRNGVPSQDCFLRVFRALDPACFESMFRHWVGDVVGALSGTVAIDGKTLCGAADADKPAVHMVSAFCTQLGVVLGQERVESKSNEITAIPQLLDALYVKGLLVSLDAMGCQREIAQKIRDQGGDYLLAVKGNQPTLHDEVRWRMQDVQSAPAHEHIDRSHGRTVLQLCWVADAQGLIDPKNWPECKTLGRVVSQRIVGDKVAELEERHYISSRILSAKELAEAVRAHWGIENRLHWMLDVCFGEDDCMVRKDNAPQNLSLLKKIVLNLIRLDTTDKVKTSMRQKRKRAAWDDDIRMAMLGIKPL
jgi:predicted transposase YbfD/YdcC